jgi:hypothetical protein
VRSIAERAGSTSASRTHTAENEIITAPSHGRTVIGSSDDRRAGVV